MSKKYRFTMELEERGKELKLVSTRFENAEGTEISLMSNTKFELYPEYEGATISKGLFQNSTPVLGLLYLFLHYYWSGNLRLASLKGKKGSFACSIADAARVTTARRSRNEKWWFFAMFTLPSESIEKVELRIKTKYSGGEATNFAELTPFWKECDVQIRVDGILLEPMEVLPYFKRIRDGITVEYPQVHILSYRNFEFEDAILDLPLTPADQLQILIANRGEFYLYLMWISSEGKLEFIYPWEDRGKAGSIPEPQDALIDFRFPDSPRECVPVESASRGYETLVLLSSRVAVPGKRFLDLDIPSEFESIGFEPYDPKILESVAGNGPIKIGAKMRLGEPGRVQAPHKLFRFQTKLEKMFENLGCDRMYCCSLANAGSPSP